ncbi:MAG: hypothetical protein LDL53_01315 [Candidatus Hydrogenedens sp.]|nr:hypothetical protein [Candidatus Hydrogenedens sp.]
MSIKKIFIAVLSIPWFWLNYVVLLIITLPFSLLEITVNGKKVRSVPIWECYLNLFQWKVNTQLFIIFAIHIGLSFLICLVIWLVLHKPVSKHKSE